MLAAKSSFLCVLRHQNRCKQACISLATRSSPAACFEDGREFSTSGTTTSQESSRPVSCQVFGRQSNFNVSFNPSRGLRTSPVFCDEVRTVNTPAFADSVSEGDVRWEKAVGDFVNEDELVGEIETDKTALPVPSPAAGIIEELLVEDGATVQAGTAIFKLRITGDAPPPAAEAPSKPAPVAAPPAAAAPPPPPAVAAPPPPPPPPPASGAGPIPVTPPPVAAMPTQPISAKPTSAVKPIQAKPKPAPAAKPAPQAAPQVIGARTETREKMTRIRKRVAERLKMAQNECAMLTTFNEIDMSNIISLRKTHQDAFVKKHGFKLGFMSAFVKASAAALQAIPAVNGVIDGGEIVYRDYVDISVAVATPKGLVVPVIRNAEAMSYATIESTINGLGLKAREGRLSVEEMDGGTFTISNGGVFGSLMGTPIINPPQSAILGMHGVFDRPVAIAGKVEIRPMMYVALTYDHRLVDGREAVTFLRRVKSAVEDPRVLLLDL